MDKVKKKYKNPDEFIKRLKAKNDRLVRLVHKTTDDLFYAKGTLLVESSYIFDNDKLVVRFDDDDFDELCPDDNVAIICTVEEVIKGKNEHGRFSEITVTSVEIRTRKD